MHSINESKVYEALEAVNYPLFGDDFLKITSLDGISHDEHGVKINLRLGIKAHSHENLLSMAIEHQLSEAALGDVKVKLSSDVLASPSLVRQGQLKDVKNIVMVASGKGGVGKSTTAINLALALRQEGAKVGILDADIYGPSMSTMLGIPAETKPELVDNKYVQPIKKYGIKSMSVAYMSQEKTPMIWRGPMAVKALEQFLALTLWGELDYLIIDMPPGTGDIHISLAQKINVSAAVVVTTPQEMALIDARKGLEMFKKVNIPVLGIVENMATHTCSNCGFEENIFGSGGAGRLAKDYGVSLLASLPLNSIVREHLDAGMPTVVSDPNSPISRTYIELANNVAFELWKCNVDTTSAPVLQIIE
ncbi:MAG: ATP-binding protein involved in chromosome partitioning [Cellvibrionaceae bacterium]|jgi:ATP-binding protein involved in chromosome partitioning